MTVNPNKNPSEKLTENPPGNPNENLIENPNENLIENPNENLIVNHPEIQIFYYAHDVNKNVIALFNSTGNIAQAYDYSPFGKTLRIDSNSVTQENVTNSATLENSVNSNSKNSANSNSVANSNLPENSANSVTPENSVNSNSNLLENSTTPENVTNSERLSSTEIIENPFQFSSEYHDDELNLIYYNYRHYNPATARWISRDPIEEQGGINLYNFVKNNSINKFDLFLEKTGKSFFRDTKTIAVTVNITLFYARTINQRNRLNLDNVGKKKY